MSQRVSFETLNQPWPWSLSFLWLWMRHLFICDVFLLFPLCSSVLEPDLHLRDKPSDQRDKPSSQLRKSAVQQSFDDLLSSPIFTFRLVVSMVTSPFISIKWCFRPYKLQTIYFLKAYHLLMTMTETITYKKTNTKTKTHIHRQRQIQSASKTQCMLYLSKAGGSRI